MPTEAQNRAKTKYNSKVYDQIKVYASKSDNLPTRIAAAALKHESSKQQYIIQAIKERLELDEKGD